MTDIFTNQEVTTPTSENNAANQQAEALVNKLLEIKREDGSPKYQSIEDALDALKNSQDHIRTIESENATLKAKATESDQLKEALARMEANRLNEGKPNDKTNVNGGLSEDAARDIVRRQLQEERQNEVLVNNVKTVQDTLIQKHGTREKAQEFILNKAKELGMSAESLKNLSATSPNAALALLGEVVKPSTALNTSTVRLPNTPATEELKAPDVSLLAGRGATTKNQMEFIKRIREKVHQELNVT